MFKLVSFLLLVGMHISQAQASNSSQPLSLNQGDDPESVFHQINQDMKSGQSRSGSAVGLVLIFEDQVLAPMTPERIEVAAKNEFGILSSQIIVLQSRSFCNRTGTSESENQEVQEQISSLLAQILNSERTCSPLMNAIQKNKIMVDVLENVQGKPNIGGLLMLLKAEPGKDFKTSSKKEDELAAHSEVRVPLGGVPESSTINPSSSGKGNINFPRGSENGTSYGSGSYSGSSGGGYSSSGSSSNGGGGWRSSEWGNRGSSGAGGGTSIVIQGAGRPAGGSGEVANGQEVYPRLAPVIPPPPEYYAFKKAQAEAPKKELKLKKGSSKLKRVPSKTITKKLSKK